MKVAVIGCGVVGAYLAWKLSRAGHNVTVFEKKQEIGGKVCSGLISGRLWNFIPENRGLVKNTINRTKIHFPGKTITLKFKQKMLIINRKGLDKYVAALAKKAGAKILLNKTINKLPENFDRIIGADGALSATRKLLGLKELSFRQGLLFFSKEKNSDDFVDTWPVENGFVWKIPRIKEVEYGIISDMKTARKKFDDFCWKNNIKISNLQAALVPQGLITSDKKEAALCGDASGLTKPWSGGGVIWNLTAADILLKNFPDFEKYGREVKKFFKPAILKAKTITNLGYLIGKRLPWMLPESREMDSDWLI